MAEPASERRRRRAVVTGAASGIGRAVAKRFEAAGIETIGVDRNSVGPPVSSFERGDLGDREALAALCDRLAAETPRSTCS